MLHLRVIAPSELRDHVVEILEGEARVTHVVLHRDAALDPKGDEITADIAQESANNVIDDFTALGLKRCGAITLDVVDTILSIAAYRAEKEADGSIPTATPSSATSTTRCGTINRPASR